MKLLHLIFFFGVGFVMGVSGVKLCKNCSVKEATIICRDCVKNFLKEILTTLFESSSTPEPLYPVLVGYDGLRVLPQFVDMEFSAVRENFISCYCTKITLKEDNTLIIYRFDIMRKPEGLDDDVLEQLIQKQAEEILANTMRFHDCYIPAEPLTLVELLPHSLNAAFARNNAGIGLLDGHKRKMRKRKALSARPENHSMKEKWDDNDKE